MNQPTSDNQRNSKKMVLRNRAENDKHMIKFINEFKNMIINSSQEEDTGYQEEVPNFHGRLVKNSREEKRRMLSSKNSRVVKYFNSSSKRENSLGRKSERESLVRSKKNVSKKSKDLIKIIDKSLGKISIFNILIVREKCKEN